jgi:hypothetical protein
MYRYLVSHNFKSGFGNAEIVRKSPISEYAQILEIQRAIELDKNIEGVTINNFILMGEDASDGLCTKCRKCGGEL